MLNDVGGIRRHAGSVRAIRLLDRLRNVLVPFLSQASHWKKRGNTDNRRAKGHLLSHFRLTQNRRLLPDGEGTCRSVITTGQQQGPLPIATDRRPRIDTSGTIRISVIIVKPESPQNSHFTRSENLYVQNGCLVGLEEEFTYHGDSVIKIA